MIEFYVCPLVTTTTPWGTTTRVGRVYAHRAAMERYTLHRGLGELVICSLADPAIATQAAIAADQQCVEWPRLDVIWEDVGLTRRRVLVEALSSHGVPLAWIEPEHTAGDVLRMALNLANARQRGHLAPIALRSLPPRTEMDVAGEIRMRAIPMIVQGVRL
jgi:hypothetical protein